MSRTRFALAFKNVVGQTPAEYVADWRVTLAQTKLREGRPIKRLRHAPASGARIELQPAFGTPFPSVPSRFPCCELRETS